MVPASVAHGSWKNPIEDREAVEDAFVHGRRKELFAS